MATENVQQSWLRSNGSVHERLGELSAHLRELLAADELSGASPVHIGGLLRVVSAYANEERRLGELDLVCASGPAVVLGEPQLLAQAVLAMLAHAGAAPSRQGPVLAVAEDHDGWVTISVGPSGDTTEQELFDWFDALSLESRAARVGLTCAREIARLHGGTLGLSCRTERELMLTLRLPATRAITAG